MLSGLIGCMVRIASCLFGHLDGMNDTGTLCEVAPELPTEVPLSLPLAGWWTSCARYGALGGKWESYNALVDVGAVGSRLFEEFGLHARPQPEGRAYINVPFTADTIPAGSAQVDLPGALMGGYRS